MTFQAFLIEAQRLREAYQHQINILIGLETEFITPLDLTRTSALILDHPEIDYLVGSVHHVNGTPIDLDRPTWLQAVQNAERSEMGSTTNPSPSGRPISAQSHFDALGSRQDSNPDLNLLRPFLLAYFDAQYKVITTDQPEVIGHIDLCLLYTPDISLSSSELGEVWEKVERNVRYVVDYGGLFEANAAAIRKGWTTSYPSPDVMKVKLDPIESCSPQSLTTFFLS